MRPLMPPAVAGPADAAATQNKPHERSGTSARAPLRRLGPTPVTHGAAGELWAAVHLGALEAAALASLAELVQRFTPRVSLAPPDGLLLEVRGSLHLFAGVAGLRAELAAECRRHGTTPVIAFAPTPLAALTAARAAVSMEVTDLAQLIGQLAPLPLTALRWPVDTLTRLKRMGVRTIGAVLRLPRAGFARRCGPDLLAMLDALTGRAPELRAAFRARARFRRRRELDCELHNHELLLAALRPLLASLGAFLKARELGAVELECRLMHRHVPPTCCVLQLAAPCADPERLGELLGARLSVGQLPEPVRACELRAAALVGHSPDALSLWQPGEHGGNSGREAGELIERLRARLGPAAVQGLQLLDAHRPESTWRVSGPPPLAPVRTPRTAGGRAVVPVRRRPLWLLHAPRRLLVRDGRPRWRGALRLVSDPERIETGWWDGAEIARDYYTAIDVHGVYLWVYRERAAPHGWFLHGVFG